MNGLTSEKRNKYVNKRVDQTALIGTFEELICVKEKEDHYCFSVYNVLCTPGKADRLCPCIFR